MMIALMVSLLACADEIPAPIQLDAPSNGYIVANCDGFKQLFRGPAHVTVNRDPSGWTTVSGQEFHSTESKKKAEEACSEGGSWWSLVELGREIKNPADPVLALKKMDMWIEVGRPGGDDNLLELESSCNQAMDEFVDACSASNGCMQRTYDQLTTYLQMRYTLMANNCFELYSAINRKANFCEKEWLELNESLDNSTLMGTQCSVMVE